MYTSKISGNNSNDVSEHDHDIHKFIEGLNIPQLNVEEQESLEKDLTFEELKDALTSFADNKSPEEKGFTKEFYEVFFDLLRKDLLNSYNEAFNRGSLSVSQKRGTITLIPKGDENLSDLKNWRPISLLNIDYKILSKALAKRMEQYLPKLIHSDQTGFVNGRYIGQNIRLLNDIMDFLDSKKCQGILLFVDFEKAFDTLEWSFISKTLEAFNFGNKFKKCDLTRKRSERLAVLKRIAVHKPFISRSNGLAYRSNASSYPFIKIHHPFERLKLSVQKNSSAVRMAQAIRSKKIVSRSNGLSYPFEKIHQAFERLELSVRNKSSAIRTVRAIRSRNPSISCSYVSSSPFKIE